MYLCSNNKKLKDAILSSIIDEDIVDGLPNNIAGKHFGLQTFNIQEKEVHSVQQSHTSNNCAVHALLNIECIIRLHQSIGESEFLNATNWFSLETAQKCRQKLKDWLTKVILQGYWK